jgi:replicative DNA helicase
MAATWLVALKAALPYLDTIANVAMPLFTKKKADAVSNQVELLQQQVSELQAASSANTERLKELAEQLKTVVVALEQAGTNVEKANRQVRVLSVIALVLAGVSLGAVIVMAVR